MFNPIKSFLYLKEAEDKSYLNLVSHPKLISPSNIYWFNAFMKKLHSRFEVESDYKTAIKLHA